MGRENPRVAGPGVTKVERCGAPVMVTHLPPGSSIDTLSAMTMEGESDERHGVGTYLVAQRGDRFCVIDEILPFTVDSMGWLEDHVVLSSESSRVRVVAHRRLHISLDAQEVESGVSDVDWEECDRFLYEEANGVLSRVDREIVTGPCSTTPSVSAP